MTNAEITEAFQAELGRAPRADELSYFMGEGTAKTGVPAMQTYEARRAIAGTPEAQQRQLMGFSKIYGEQLGAGDEQILGKSQAMLTGQFAGLGRQFSSGYVGAFASAARDLALARQQAQAGFVGQGLGQIFSATGQQGQAQTDRRYQLSDEQRKYEQEQNLAQYWYQRQSNDYQDQLNQQRRLQKQSAIGGFAGSAIGAGLGGMVGGMPGASIGSSIGGKAGGLF
jgi:hypothetical protein